LELLWHFFSSNKNLIQIKLPGRSTQSRLQFCRVAKAALDISSAAWQDFSSRMSDKGFSREELCSLLRVEILLKDQSMGKTRPRTLDPLRSTFIYDDGQVAGHG
jgi:hypothetical protein